MTEVIISEESPGHPDLAKLECKRRDYFRTLYPNMRNPLTEMNTLTGAGSRVFVVRRQGRALAMGAIVQSGEIAEVKGMFVDDTFRGQGFGRMLIRTLEDAARKNGAVVVRAESGRLQLEANNLYRSEGYQEIGPFGGYVVGPNSVFFERRLAQ